MTKTHHACSHEGCTSKANARYIISRPYILAELDGRPAVLHYCLKHFGEQLTCLKITNVG